MSILIDANTRLLVQGITGKEGEFHTRQMIEYGTKVVAGVVPDAADKWRLMAGYQYLTQYQKQ